MEGGGGDPADGSAAASSAVDPRSVDEEVIRRHCEQYNDEMKGQAGRSLSRASATKPGGSEPAFTCYPLPRAPDSPFTGPDQARGRCVVTCSDVK